MFFRHCFLHRFFVYFLVGNGTKMYPRLRGAAPLFAPEIDHTCTFYHCNTYKCQKQFFHFFFFKKLNEFIHTCTFYPRNTYKCAMTVFTIFKNQMDEKKKENFERSKTWFLMIFLIFGSLLASFGLPFGSLWLPFGSLRMSNFFKNLVFVRFGFTFCWCSKPFL